MRVAAPTLGHLDVHLERWGRVESPGEADRRVLGAPGAGRAGVVEPAVPVEVEPGAAPDLQRAQRQPRGPSEVQEAAEERGRAADLVGLHRQFDQRAQLCGVRGHGGAKVGPRVARGLTPGRRVVPGQRGRRAAQHQPVHGGHEAEGEHRADRIALVTGHRLPAGTAGLDVVRGAAEQLGVERRADRAAQLGLPPQRRGGRLAWRRLGQATSAGSSLPARRSRPRCTAAMNFERLTSRVLRISSA